MTGLLAGAPRGHTAVFGAGPASLAATAVEVFGAARASGEALVLMTDDADLRTLDALPDRDHLVASGRLQVVRTADAYPHRDPARLLAAFDDVLRTALADGWTGIRVVAENTSLLTGGGDAFSDWLAWEHVTAQWQQAHPVVGVCWFDTTALDVEQVVELASVHGEVHGVPGRVPFRLLPAAGVVRLRGDVDATDVARLVRLLAAVPRREGDELVVDLSDAGYVHHTVFTTVAPPGGDVTLTGVRGVHRRVWDALGGGTGRVALG